MQSKNQSTFSDQKKKVSGKTLKLDPTPISGFEKVRRPWDKPVGCHCERLPPEVSPSPLCLPKSVKGIKVGPERNSHNYYYSRPLISSKLNHKRMS
ncbi:hypothetical protein TNCV_1389621 [Trichonephila clavipes]|nr:hypothetical protein TNCV_1389621 [Trichonephila clavipes]